MTYQKLHKFHVVRNILGYREFFILLVLSSATAVFFAFKGFMPGDQIRYALGLQSIVERGLAWIPHVFNGEMSFGYYFVLYFLDKLIGDSVTISGLMNNLNAVTSVAMQCSLFFLFCSLTGDKKLSFFACLTILLSPTIWNLSHYGHPGLLSLTFFIGSLLIYDKILYGRRKNPHSSFLWFSFIILSLIAITFRHDIVLAFGAFFGIMYFRRAVSIPNLVKTFGALFIALFLLLSLRYFILGYLINPTGGAIALSITYRLAPEFIVRNIIKNCVLWAFSANVLIFLIAGIGIIRSRLKSKIVVLLIFWVVPWCIFFPFRAMNYARIVAPTIPIISLIAVNYINFKFKRRRIFALSLMLVLSQIVSVATYYPLVRIYPFKNEIEGRVMAAFPIGLLPLDHYYRQQMILTLDHTARLVTNERNRSVMIFGCCGSEMYYRLYLEQFRGVTSKKEITCNRVRFSRWVTEENDFYILNLDHNWLIRDPIRRAINCVTSGQTKIHFIPFWGEYPTRADELFISEQAILSILDREAANMEKRRKIIFK